jgi:Flp pilus assembly protein protease CpaA
MVAELLADPLLRLALLALWLLPCAIQDWRIRRVANWLTVPLFLLAWPCALALHTVPLTLATFAGFWLAFQFDAGGMGGADGKIATGVAALAPVAFVMGLVISGLACGILRLRGERSPRVPGAVCFYLGVVLTFPALAAQAGLPGQ